METNIDEYLNSVPDWVLHEENKDDTNNIEDFKIKIQYPIRLQKPIRKTYEKPRLRNLNIHYKWHNYITMGRVQHKFSSCGDLYKNKKGFTFMKMDNFSSKIDNISINFEPNSASDNLNMQIEKDFIMINFDQPIKFNILIKNLDDYIVASKIEHRTGTKSKTIIMSEIKNKCITLYRNDKCKYSYGTKYLTISMFDKNTLDFYEFSYVVFVDKKTQ